MKKVSKVRLKPAFRIFLKVLGIIICILLGLFLFYKKQIGDLTKLGYSEKASQKILFSKQKDYILSIGGNKTLNLAFESDNLILDNLDIYRKIDYVNHKHLIRNINKLIDVGYSTSDINIILKHGDDDSVYRFSKREKVKYLEEFFVVSYAKLDNYDRYVNYEDLTGEDEETTVLFVNLDMDKDDYTDVYEVKDFSVDMLINKHRFLAENFVPSDLMVISSDYTNEEGLKSSRLAFYAYKKMSDAAKMEGYEIVINSAYRSYNDQKEIADLYFKTYGQDYVDKYVAKPGFSEHQTGLAFDIGSRSVNVFANSEEYKWMRENAYKYGFIERFTKKYENITGFRSEPWHYRYVGEDIAKYIYENNITLEEYWALYLDI